MASPRFSLLRAAGKRVGAKYFRMDYAAGRHRTT